VNSRTSSWRAAYQRCLQIGVDPAALTRLGRGIGGGTPSAQWNAGQAALAEFLFTLTATLVEMYPPDAARFPALAAACPEDSTLAARWLVTVLDLVETFDPVNTRRFRRALLDALQETPSDRSG
jgi:hypothetical protein